MPRDSSHTNTENSAMKSTTITSSDQMTTITQSMKTTHTTANQATTTIVTDNSATTATTTTRVSATTDGTSSSVTTQKSTSSTKETSGTSITTESSYIHPVQRQEAILLSSIDRLRDPCVLLENGTYYIYGTGWVGYKNTSGSLSGSWELMPNLVTVPADAKDNYWAPEVHKYKGAYYMFTTYASKTTGKRGCTVLKADSPEGPFVEISDGTITPDSWHAIDGTLYVDESGQLWMIFVREWVGTEDTVGRMVAAKLSDDLTHFISEPIELFRADDPGWAAQTITDGCWLYKCATGELLMIWSNFDRFGYCIGVARSDNGKVDGNWIHDDELLYSASMGIRYDGGHGMIFQSIEGQLYLSLHSPNGESDGRFEKPIFIPIKEKDGTLVWDVK